MIAELWPWFHKFIKNTAVIYIRLPPEPKEKREKKISPWFQVVSNSTSKAQLRPTKNVTSKKKFSLVFTPGIDITKLHLLTMTPIWYFWKHHVVKTLQNVMKIYPYVSLKCLQSVTYITPSELMCSAITI